MVRMLADDDIEFVEKDTPGDDNLSPGEDGNLDDSEVADVTEIPQTTLTDELDTELAKIDETKDGGSVGGDSSVDDSLPGSGSSDEGTSFMTWVMYIGGAILVLSLIAGACYLIQQRNDAAKWDRDAENTEMTSQM